MACCLYSYIAELSPLTAFTTRNAMAPSQSATNVLGSTGHSNANSMKDRSPRRSGFCSSVSPGFSFVSKN